MIEKNIRNTINQRTYAAEKVVRWYRDLSFIHKSEEVILQRLYPFIKDKKLLDIGIGGGRTTKYLLEISKDYIGIDYTLGLTEIVKSKYPQSAIFCADARELHLRDEVFDFVLFSLNGLDYIDHDDRLKALGEIYRVLKPGGFYMFSTHNRDYKGFKKLPWQEDTPFSLGHLRSCLYTLAHWPRHLVMRQHELFKKEYAIVNDSAHGFSLFTYYIGIGEQLKQLERKGFEQIEAYNMVGNPVKSDSDFPWTYYLARKGLAENLSAAP
jgi:ubiquinone/menaquinone biosynthesis C-methylase UbiE